MVAWTRLYATFAVTIQLVACGGSKSSSGESAPAEEAQVQEPDVPSPASLPQPPIQKGESTDVTVAVGNDEKTSSTLTLFNVGNNRIAWSDSKIEGTIYRVFQRSEAGQYDESVPWQTVSDMASLDLPELPDINCYKVRAVFPADQGSVDSNEVCIRGPARLEVDDLPATKVAATQTMSILWKARGGASSPVYSCAQACPEGLSIQESGLIVWTPSTSQMGNHNVIFAVTSGTQSLQKTLTITVDEAPLLFTAPAPQSLTAPATLSLNLIATADSLPVTFACTNSCPEGMLLSPAGLLSWTPSFSQVGLHQVTLRAQTALQTVERVLSITVNEPVLTFTSQLPLQVVATELLQFNLAASASGQSIFYACVASCPEGLAVNASTGAVSWTPLSSQTGTFSPLFRVVSGSQTAEQTISIQVQTAFINLSLNSGSTLVGEGTIVITASTNSNLTQPPTWQITQEAGPTVALTSGAQQWTFVAPNIRTATDFRFKVTATVGSISRDEMIELRLIPNDHAPEWSAIAHQDLVASQNFVLSTVAQDVDGDTLSYSCILDCPSGFSIDPLTGLISWTPGLDQIGSHGPVLQVAANGRTATQALSILVAAPSMTILAAPISGISGESANISITVTSNLSGPFQFTFTQLSGPALTLNGSGSTRSFAVPDLNFPANVSFDLSVSNGIFSASQNINGRLDPQPIAPTVDLGPDQLARQPVTLNATVSANSQTLTWTKISGRGNVIFGSPGSSSTEVSATQDGVYVLRLTASNSWLQNGSDDLQLTWDTTAPSVYAGEEAISRSTFSRTATVNGHSSLLWSKVTGPGTLSFSAPAASSTNISASVDGEYLVRLTASDAAGNTAFSEFILTFDFTPPSIDPGPPLLSNSATLTVRATLSDDTESQVWTKISGPGAASFATADQAETNVTFVEDGVYVIQIAASDVAGNMSQSQLSITIDRQAPVINSIAPGLVVADGYLNLVEHQEPHALLQPLTANDLTNVVFSYKLVPDGLACDASLIYETSIPLSTDPTFITNGSYKVCVQAKDVFNQTSYDSAPPFIYDTGTVSVSMTSLPASVGSSTSLAAVATGTDVTHFRAKVGFLASTQCSDLSGYSPEYEVSSPFTQNFAGLEDGVLVLCAIGRNQSGNWQDAATAFQYTWTLDREAPLAPADMSITGLTKRIKLAWSTVAGAAGYIVVRSDVPGPWAWVPFNGQTYTTGQSLDSSLKVVSVGSTRPVFDNAVDPNVTYEYAVFAYDAALNYSLPSQGSAYAAAAISINTADGFDRSVRQIVPAPDGSGKYYVAGDFLAYGQRVASRLIRFNPDMTVDTSFNPPLFNNVIYAIASSTDGKLYVGGAFTSFTGFPHNRLVRLHADGSVDADFNVGTGFNSTVQSLALDETLNRLYVGGAFTSYKGVTASRLTALNIFNASVDSSFTCGTCITTPSNAAVNAMVVIPGQGLYIGGSFTNLSGITTNRVARLSAAGVRDATFTGTGFDSTVLTLAVDASGNVYAGGSFGKYRGSSNAYRFTRLIASTGAIDSSLPVTSKFNGTVHSIHLDAAGDVYVGGDFTAFGTNPAIRLARLSPNGSLNTALSAEAPIMQGLPANAGFPVLAIQSNGDHILVGGSFQRVGTVNVSYLVRLNTTGTLTSGLLRGTMMNSSVYAIAPTNEPGEHLVGGYFTSYQGQQAYRIARINKNGIRDATLANSITTAAYVYALAFDAGSGKFYAGGTFTSPSGRLARFNSNGSIDSAFNSVITSTGFNSDVYALAIDPATGAIYVGGKFTTLKTAGMAAAQTVNYLVRLLPNGYIDTSFQTGTGFNGQVNALQVLQDGSLLVGGAFTSFNGTSVNRLIQLNADGTINNSLDIGTGFNGAVQALQFVASDGSLYVCGAFTSYRGSSANRLIRLNAQGTPGTGWSFGTGLSGTAYALDWDEHNEVLWVGGNFGTVRGTASSRLAALNRDGSLHTAFAPGSGFNGDIRALSADAWGTLFGGAASTYQGRVVDFFGRLLFDGSTP